MTDFRNIMFTFELRGGKATEYGKVMQAMEAWVVKCHGESGLQGPFVCCFVLRMCGSGCRDGSVVKSTDCSSRGPEFNSQQLHGGSQPSVMRSVFSSDQQAYMQPEQCIYNK